MSGFVRYTCNKKNEPTMREDCLTCPDYNPCAKDGEWCFVGALIAETESAVAPVMRDMSTVNINLDNGCIENIRAVVIEGDMKILLDEVCKVLCLPKGFLEK